MVSSSPFSSLFGFVYWFRALSPVSGHSWTPLLPDVIQDGGVRGLECRWFDELGCPLRFGFDLVISGPSQSFSLSFSLELYILSSFLMRLGGWWFLVSWWKAKLVQAAAVNEGWEWASLAFEEHVNFQRGSLYIWIVAENIDLFSFVYLVSLEFEICSDISIWWWLAGWGLFDVLMACRRVWCVWVLLNHSWY